MDDNDSKSVEDRLRTTWSIGPLRPWLKMLAERQLSSGLRGKVDASDIVQQALLDAWCGRESFRGETHAERLAWLRVILTRVILRKDRDLLKTEKRGKGIEQQLQAAIDHTSVCLERMVAGDDAGPATRVELSEQALALAASLDQLSEGYREVLILRHFDGLSHAEIAAKMDKSPAAIRMTWVRALAELRNLMDVESHERG